MKIIQEAAVALQAEQNKFPIAELALQRGWLAQEQAVRREYQNEYEVERKPLLAKLEGTLPDINIKGNQTIIYKNFIWNLDQLFPGQNMEDLSQTLSELRDLETNIITAQQLGHLSIYDAY